MREMPFAGRLDAPAPRAGFARFPSLGASFAIVKVGLEFHNQQAAAKPVAQAAI